MSQQKDLFGLPVKTELPEFPYTRGKHRDNGSVSIYHEISKQRAKRYIDHRQYAKVEKLIYEYLKLTKSL